MAGGEARQENPAQRLGGALRALQQRSGRTLRSLEADVAISDSSLSRYLRGATVPPWATVRDLCRALGGDPAEYRALWEAAERSQPQAGPGERPAPPPSLAEPVTPEAPGAAPGPTRVPGPGPEAGPGPGGAPRRARRLLRSRRAWALAGALAGAVVGSALTALALPPSAPEQGAGTGPRHHAGAPAAGRMLVNRSTGACLDDSLDAGLRAFTCNALSYQKWTVRTGGDGTSSLRNHATGGCLAQDASGPHTAACGTATAQKWKATALPDDAMEVRSVATGDCLEHDSAGLRARACASTAAQKWA
ncbi:helix-turn-helix domain-containing protein [Streptomyces sp. cmx-18-6]|uniref:helix-turn-helix domain-containing protein n=1 Tax=Streptomyces sp. cmx-18-6 TaxID=2790930 RepID=UPI0039808136